MEEDVEGLAGQLVVATATSQVVVHHFQQLQLETGNCIGMDLHLVVAVVFYLCSPMPVPPTHPIIN